MPLEDDAKKKKKGRVGDMKSNTVKIETIVKMAIWASYSCECCIIKLIDLILKLLHISTVFLGWVARRRTVILLRQSIARLGVPNAH